MPVESASSRQQEWTLVVRRSFGIPDAVDHEDARRALVRGIEDQLHEHGWHSATRAIAQPMMDALIVLGASGELDAWLLAADGRVSPDTASSRDAAHRLLDRGTTVVDPEGLVFDVTDEYPPEVITVAEQALDRVSRYVRERSFGV